jgi:D-sedoheptulose 7-phosphate isomerase
MSRATTYFKKLGELSHLTSCWDIESNALSVDEGIEQSISLARETHDAGNKLMFIGNGGSAGIASHLAIDYLKNGKLRSQTFNDGAALTCLANDLGYESVFSAQIEMHARKGDLLIAISSSGASKNILAAVKEARKSNCQVLTFSGFSKGNLLSRMGDVNFYVPSYEYGFVEITHLSLCHAVLDLLMGWSPDK